MKEISVQDFKRMRDEGELHRLIDVREPYEHDELNMGGELIPMGDIPSQLDTLPKDIPLILHCRSGTRSGNMVRFMEQKGFQNVYSLRGGIRAWVEQIEPELGTI